MARGALLPKAAVMDVFMARCAVLGLEVVKEIAALLVMRGLPKSLRRRRMAFDAFHIQMQPFENKTSHIVVKWLSSRKSRGGMALAAGLVCEFFMELVSMFIFMARLTIPLRRVREEKERCWLRRLGR